MPNKNYVKGRRKEYKLCEKLRSEGNEIVQRTAGSHSPIDIIAIDKMFKIITLVQAKPDNFSETETKRLNDKLDWLNGVYHVRFEVR